VTRTTIMEALHALVRRARVRSRGAVAATTCWVSVCVLTAWTGQVASRRQRHMGACASGHTTLVLCALTDTVRTSRTGRIPVVLRNTSAVEMSYAPTCAASGTVLSCGLETTEVRVGADTVGGVTVAYVAGASSGPGAVTVDLDGGGSDIVTAVVTVMVVGGGK
jgi:hypothetical protein